MAAHGFQPTCFGCCVERGPKGPWPKAGRPGGRPLHKSRRRGCGAMDLNIDSWDKMCHPVWTSAPLGGRHPVPLIPSLVPRFGILSPSLYFTRG